MKSFQKISTMKQKISEEQNTNKELLQTIRVMTRDENVLSTELNNTELCLVKELDKTSKLDKKVYQENRTRIWKY